MKKKAQERRIQKLLEESGGGTATTNSLNLLPESLAREIKDSVDLVAGEESLLASSCEPGRWCLLTTSRLLWFQKGKLQDLYWHDVRGAQQPPVQSAAIIRGELQKNQISDLEIFDTRDTKYTLHLEPGGYHIVWSAILALCNCTRKLDSIDLASVQGEP